MPLAPALRGQLIRAKADVHLVGDQGSMEEIHSILLMTLSPYFQIVLDNSDSKSVRMCGADSEVLRLIKEYAYEGKITGLSKENVDKVHRVADMYNIVAILRECERINATIPSDFANGAAAAAAAGGAVSSSSQEAPTF